MECKYHTILDMLHAAIWERIDTHYDWVFFGYWLGDDSNLGFYYKETFEQIVEEPLTEEQNTLLEKKGSNLEIMICKWLSKWKTNNPEPPNEKMPGFCLKIKIYEYIIYQLNKADIREIIGIPC
jgi:hypothetical protein